MVEEADAFNITHDLQEDNSSLALAEKAERKHYNQEIERQFPELEYIGQLHGT